MNCGVYIYHKDECLIKMNSLDILKGVSGAAVAQPEQLVGCSKLLWWVVRDTCLLNAFHGSLLHSLKYKIIGIISADSFNQWKALSIALLPACMWSNTKS